MNEKEKEVLLKEIENVNGKYVLVLDDFESFCEVSLLKQLKDEKMSKKILIKNEYGILGNLLYKYREVLDDEVLMSLVLADCKCIASLYGSKEIFDICPIEIKELISNNRRYLLWFLDSFNDAIVLKDVNYKWYDDRDFILLISDKCDIPFDLLNDKYMDDKEIVLKLVSHISRVGLFLEKVSDRLKKDKEVVMEAIKRDIHTLEYASDALKSDKEFILELVKQDVWTLQYASDELKNNRDVVTEAIKRDFSTLSLTKNKELVIEIVKNNVRALEFVNKELLDDKDFAMNIIKIDANAIHYISNRLVNDSDILNLIEF